MGPGDLMAFFIDLIKKRDLSIFPVDLMNGSIEDRINLYPVEYIANFLTDIYVFLIHQAGGRIENSDLAPKPTKHLSELQPNIASPQYKQVVRGFLKVHNGGAG